MKPNEMPSAKAESVMFILTLLFAIMVICMPTLSDIAEKSGSMAVPGPDAAGYDESLDGFEDEYGTDEKAAEIHNTGMIILSYFGICFAFLAVQYAVYDCYKYIAYKKAGDQPRDIKQQAVRTGIILACAAIMGCWYFLAPYLIP